MFRDLISKILTKLLEKIEKKQKKISVRQKLPVWYKEVHIPPFLIISIIGLLIFLTLLFELEPSIKKAVGLLIFVIFVFILFIYYLKKEETELIKDNDALMLLGLLALTSVLNIEIFRTIYNATAFIVPIWGMSVIISLLLNKKVATMLLIPVCAVCGMMNNSTLSFTLFHLISGFSGISFSTKINHRKDVFQIGLLMCLVNIFILLCLILLGIVKFNFVFFYHSLLNSAISVALIYVFLFPLETFFSRITNIKLIELSDFNQPLLKKLMTEAQGTYHHSLAVASIAENASKSIGLNSLLVRVGAYYHDIGKLIKPQYFIENQIAMQNPHDEISASMSGIVVISHVKEGVSIAKKYHLDKPIIDLIEQHHGTSLLQLVYQKALLEDVDAIKNRSEESFRYPGPKPKTKEAAILLLSDSCEAAARSKSDISINVITDLVKTIINDKFNDEQLNDTQLTFSDIEKITTSIINSLIGIHHAR